MNLFKRTALLALAASAIIPSVAVARPSNAPGQGRTGCTSEAINPMFPNTRQVVAWYSWHDRENNQWHWDINMNQDALAACRRQLASASTPTPAIPSYPPADYVVANYVLGTDPKGCTRNGTILQINRDGSHYQSAARCTVSRISIASR
jgi:hypothetical protein